MQKSEKWLAFFLSSCKCWKKRLIAKQEIKDVTAVSIETQIQNFRPHVYLYIKSDKYYSMQKVKVIDNMFIFTLKAWSC